MCKKRGVAANCKGGNPNCPKGEVRGQYIGRLAGRMTKIPPMTTGTPLARPVKTFVTAEVAYGLRFRRNFDPRAQRVELFDRTSLR